MIDKEGIPTTFIRCLVELEDFIKEVWLTLSSLAIRRKNVTFMFLGVMFR